MRYEGLGSGVVRRSGVGWNGVSHYKNLGVITQNLPYNFLKFFAFPPLKYSITINQLILYLKLAQNRTIQINNICTKMHGIHYHSLLFFPVLRRRRKKQCNQILLSAPGFITLNFKPDYRKSFSYPNGVKEA